MSKTKPGPKGTVVKNTSGGAVAAYSNTIFYLLLPLLFLAPFFRGLFFYEELTIAHMYSAVIAGIYFYLNREKIRFPRNMMDYAGFGLVIAYLLSSFVAVNSRNGIGLLMKTFNYFLIYLLVSKAVRNADQMKKLLTTLFISGIGVALAGIGTAFGTFNFEGAFLDGLISSTIQYHNAAAIFLFAAGMIGLALTNMRQDTLGRISLAGVSYIVLITATGAGSRGALLVAPIAMLVQFLGFPRADKEKYFYTALSVLVPLVITAKSVLTFHENSSAYHWGMLWLGFFLTCIIQYGFDRFYLLGGNQKRNYLLSTGAVIMIALVAILAVKGSEVMPASVADRFKEFHLQNQNVMDRFNFYSDAMKIIKDHPVLGVGGGGWNSIYRSYQSFLYDTSEVHNHFLQLWVESGTVGFVFYILLWTGFLISSVRVLLRSGSNQIKVLSWSAFTAALAIGMHSAIDFTLSLGAIMFFLWSLMGLVRASEEQVCANDENYYYGFSLEQYIRKYAGIIIALIFFAASASFSIGVSQANKAIEVYMAGDLDEAISTLETSVKFDPFTSKSQMDLSEMYTDKASQQPDAFLLAKALKGAKAAAEYDEANPEAYWLLSRTYYNSRQFDQAVLEAEKAVTLAPFLYKSYTELAMFYNAIAGNYIQMGDKESARIILDKTLQLPDKLKAQDAKLTKEGRLLFKRDPIDKVMPMLQKYMDEAQQMKQTL